MTLPKYIEDELSDDNFWNYDAMEGTVLGKQIVESFRQAAALPTFVSFGKIERWKEPVECTITQKLHGTNAHILIEKLVVSSESGPTDPQLNYTKWVVQVGSRTRWIRVGDDNYGFAAWVEKNKVELIDFLGEGHHFGEWCGPGINSGEGLDEKTFVLFDWWKHAYKPLPKGVALVPVLYNGPWNEYTMSIVMNELKTQGSRLRPGFMRPEGVVMYLNGRSYKSTFEQEETAWKRPDKEKVQVVDEDVLPLLQPMRMEKLISRDERYRRGFPETLPELVKDYVADLIAENQLPSDPDLRKAITKKLGRHVFPLAREVMMSQMYKDVMYGH